MSEREETEAEHIARDMREGRFPSRSARKSREINWKESPPFITSTSAGDSLYVTVKVHSMEELHAAHDLIINAFKREIFDNVIAGVIDAQIA